MKKNVGVNLRLTTSVFELLAQAQSLEIPFFQCFLTSSVNGHYVSYTQDEYDTFLTSKGPIQIYAHGSYKINLANPAYRNDSCFFLRRELELAKKIGATHLVAHPGSTINHQDHMQGIDNVAKKINRVYKKGDHPILLLENVAFGNRAIGGDINDLALIRSKLDKPEKVQFCIDTAHAYTYGYNIACLEEQLNFVNLIDELLGIESVALIHLNDTKEELGTKRDRHDIPGNGNIGITALKQFISDPRLIHIPLMLELPLLSEGDLKTTLEFVKSWI